MHSVRLALRELGRRRLRSTLTIGGIAIGVSALLLLGGLAERLIHLVAGGRAFASGQISVSGAGAGALSGMTRGALVTGEQLALLATVPGVTAVAPIVMFPLGDAPATMPFGLPTLVFGVDMGSLFFAGSNHRVPPPPVQSGQLMPTPNSNEVVLGSQVAGRFGASTGSRITVRGREFVVVGVLGPTLTGPDSFVFMPFGTAEQLLLDTEPVLRKLALVPGASVLPVAPATSYWPPPSRGEAGGPHRAIVA
jgi:putative ABC transport system permease protein